MESSTVSQQTLLNCISVSGLALLIQKYQKQNNREQSVDDIYYRQQGIFIMYAFVVGILLALGDWLFQKDILGHMSDIVLSGACLRVLLHILDIFCSQSKKQTELSLQKKHNIRILLLLIGLRSYNIRRSLRIILGYIVDTMNISKRLSSIINRIESSYDLFPEERWLNIKTTLGYKTAETEKKLLEYSILSVILILWTRGMRKDTRIHYSFVCSSIALFLVKCYIQRKNLPPIPYIHEILLDHTPSTGNNLP